MAPSKKTTEPFLTSIFFNAFTDNSLSFFVFTFPLNSCDLTAAVSTLPIAISLLISTSTAFVPV